MSFLASKYLKHKRKNRVPKNRFAIWLPAFELHIFKADGAIADKIADKKAIFLLKSIFTRKYWDMIKRRKRRRGASFNANGLIPNIRKKKEAIKASRLPQYACP